MPHSFACVGTLPQNRSIERGVEILRAFRPGADYLGNGELAERTGLARSTVSRITQTLVGTGLLEQDHRHRAYRLAPLVLCLANAMRGSSRILQAAVPLMRLEAEKHKVNVGLAVPDRHEMLYLESIRYNREGSLRTVVSGQRIPMELTSLGRAYLATLTIDERRDIMALFKSQRRAGWRNLSAEINAAIDSVHDRGFCFASWQPRVVAVAAPVVVKGLPVHVLNMSVTTEAPASVVAAKLSVHLLALRLRLNEVFAQA